MSSRLSTRLATQVLRWAPKGAFSHAVGWLSRRRVPRGLRNAVYGGFARAVGADLDEVDRPLESFERFDDFFTRPLPVGARPIDTRPNHVVSPVDGVVSQLGRIDGTRMIQCKGRDYTVRGLLADDDVAKQYVGGHFCTIYLAPRNYHRIHSPVAGKVTGYRHVPGAFFPVNELSVENIQGLFTINERLTTYIDGECGRVAVVKVAATGVGHITVDYEPALYTHIFGPSGRQGHARNLPSAVPVVRGQELAMFHLGSTVILLFEPGRIGFAALPGQPVRMGEVIAEITTRTSRDLIA